MNRSYSTRCPTCLSALVRTNGGVGVHSQSLPLSSSLSVNTYIIYIFVVQEKAFSAAVSTREKGTRTVLSKADIQSKVLVKMRKTIDSMKAGYVLSSRGTYLLFLFYVFFPSRTPFLSLTATFFRPAPPQSFLHCISFFSAHVYLFIILCIKIIFIFEEVVPECATFFYIFNHDKNTVILIHFISLIFMFSAQQDESLKGLHRLLSRCVQAFVLIDLLRTVETEKGGKLQHSVLSSFIS
jgi:hypothetical protein